MTSNDSKVWLITGSSTGFGRALAEAVLKTGYRLIATARKPEQLQELVDQYPTTVLKVVTLDVTNPEQIKIALQEAMTAFHRIDILVNNAGYGLIGALEEVSDEQIRRNFETNFFGAINMIRSILPIMRKQQSGHIINITAIAGFNNETGFSIYGATKFALEGVSESLREEVKPFGIKVTIVEPGPFRTDFVCRSLDRVEEPMIEYEPTVGKFLNFVISIDGKQAGDPIKGSDAIIQMVESNEKAPLRFVLGKYAYISFRNKITNLTEELNQWEELGKNTDYE